MKRLLLLCALAIPCFMACEKMDEAVSPDVEQQQDPLTDVIRIAMDGASMLEDGATRATANRRVNLDAISCKIHPATRAGEANDTLYYVVNYADNAGFAIVSADEHATDGERLLAVIEQGSYTAGETTGIGGFDGFVSLLDYEIIGGKDSLTLDLSRYETVQTYSPWSGVEPLLQVMWGQGENVGASQYDPNTPYNKYCVLNGLLCPTGCSAVAIAQIMSYHKAPVSYIRTYDDSDMNVTLDWDSILSWIGGTIRAPEWSDTGVDALAHLMREMGFRVNAKYTTNGTNITYQQSKQIFTHFGYSTSELIDNDFTTLQNELHQNRPVFMGGSSLNGYSNDGEPIYSGHAWVADGYKSRNQHSITYKITPSPRGDIYEIIQEYDELFRYAHYNWGANGFCNGYFKAGVFRLNGADDEAGGYDNPNYSNVAIGNPNYNYYVRMFIGISHN